MSFAHVLFLFLSLFASCFIITSASALEDVYKHLTNTLRQRDISVYGSPDLSRSWEALTKFAEWRQYYKSVVVSNAACSGNVGSAGGCPAFVVRPTCAEQVSAIIQLCAKYNVTVSIRGGGHSYTCQGSKRGGVMIDTRSLRSIRLAEGEEGGDVVELGAGLTWGEVLRYLRPRNYSIVHGQCTSVGVAGFALHGGVHFGGLSEVFGLASDNIVGITLVDARGRIVSLTSTNCSINGQPVIDVDVNNNGSAERSTTFQDCQDLWFAMRGSGSSFGVATSITMRVHRFLPSSPPFPSSPPPPSPPPISPLLSLSSSSHQEKNKKLVSALSILTINTHNSTLAQQAISHFMLSVDQSVSLTFFGLDAYFKAYSFIVKFAKNRLRQGISYDIKSLFSSPFKKQRQGEGGGESVEKSIHFIVEASWLSGEEEENEEKMQKRNRMLAKLNEALLNLSAQSLSVKVVESRPFVLTADTWSVPSYDLVWGSGHFYAGATIGVTTFAQEQQVIRATFDRHNDHILKSTNKCSDCVTVFHRVGPGLRSFANSTSSSFHPLRANLSLWLEVDCGHFFRKASSWRHCNSFVDETQTLLDMAADTAVASEDGSIADPKEKDEDSDNNFHYPNVPNLSHSKNSVPAKYFGKNVARLVTAKKYWDPDNVFHHSQSVPLHSFSGKNSKHDSRMHSQTETEQKVTGFSNSLQSTCKFLYFFAALRDYRRVISFISFSWGLKALWSLASKVFFPK